MKKLIVALGIASVSSLTAINAADLTSTTPASTTPAAVEEVTLEQPVVAAAIKNNFEFYGGVHAGGNYSVVTDNSPLSFDKTEEEKVEQLVKDAKADVATATGAVTPFQTAVTNAQAVLKTKQEDLDTAEKASPQVAKTIQNAKSAVTTAKSTLATAQESLKSAENEAQNAQDKYDTLLLTTKNNNIKSVSVKEFGFSGGLNAGVNYYVGDLFLGAGASFDYVKGSANVVKCLGSLDCTGVDFSAANIVDTATTSAKPATAPAKGKGKKTAPKVAPTPAPKAAPVSTVLKATKKTITPKFLVSFVPHVGYKSGKISSYIGAGVAYTTFDVASTTISKYSKKDVSKLNLSSLAPVVKLGVGYDIAENISIVGEGSYTLINLKETKVKWNLFSGTIGINYNF